MHTPPPLTRPAASPDADRSVPTARPTHAPAKFDHVPGLDGLRGLAVIAVLLYHAHFGFATGGFLGVSVFFTLSGFLICSLLLREHHRSGTISLGSFWSRRFRRLLPASLLTVAAVVVMGLWGVWDGDQIRSLRADVPGAVGQVLNWVFIAKGTSYAAATTAPSPLNHFWSLAIEEQFYLVFPSLCLLALWLGRGRRGLLVGFSTTLIALSAWWNGRLAADDVNRAYFGLDTRVGELLVGVLLACATYRVLVLRRLWPRVAVTVAGTVGLVVLVWLCSNVEVSTPWLYPWGLGLASLCTAAVILMAMQQTPIAALFRWGPLRHAGRISYGLYLYHWPIFQWLTPARTGLAQLPLFAVRMAVTMAIAELSFHLFETPIRERRFLAGRSFAPAIASFAALVVLGGVVATADPPEERRSLAGLETGASTTVPPRPQRVLLLGDETAASLVDPEGTSALLDEHGVVLDSLLVPGCGATVGGTRKVTGQPDEAVNPSVCDTLPERWAEREAAFRPDVVIVSVGFWDVTDRQFWIEDPVRVPAEQVYLDFTNAELQARTDELAAGGATVVWTTMAAQRRVLPGVEADPSTLSENSELRAAWFNERLDELAEHDPRVRVVAFDRAIAEAGADPFDRSVRPDGVTFSDTAAARLLGWLLEEVEGLERSANPDATGSAGMTDDAADAEIPPAPDGWEPLRVAEGEQPRIMMVGDSVAFGLGWALEEWGKEHGGAVFMNRGQFNCPIARGGTYRFEQRTTEFPDRCDWSVYWAQVISESRPHEVAIFNGVWDVVDRILPGQRAWSHLGEPVSDAYFLRELVAAIDLLSSQGARVTLLTHHYIEVGENKGFVGLPESDHDRIDRYNELLAEAVALRPNVARIADLAGHLQPVPGQRLDPSLVFDGLHFTDPALLDIADWLAPRLVENATDQR